MAIYCSRCGSDEFRTSRFRAPDLGRILFLQFPVRCRACMQRKFAPLQGFLRIRQESIQRHRDKDSAGGTPGA